MPNDLPGSQAAREFHETASHAPWVLVVDADPALFELIAEWLGDEGFSVVPGHGGAAPGRISLVIVDVPFPRQDGLTRLRRLADEHPGTPILALSSTFFAGIESHGAVARALGVAGVLPKPLKRDALVAAVKGLLHDPKCVGAP